ncbi:MAG: acyl-ACP thioesterase domain-containing protein, partial [Acidimicrobiales bacterium]
MTQPLPAPQSELVPRPATGRVFEEARRVRLGDVSPGGRLRLDAATRYLQDLSADDTADAALPDAESWVVRKTVIEVRAFPRYLEPLELATWCSGTGSHWAERRISMVGEAGSAVEAATTWVHVDQTTGRPKRVPESFHALYGEASGGRRMKARLEHPDPPSGARPLPWALRFSDFDVLSHVNNAAYWEAVEEALSSRRELRAPLRAEVEHRTAV